MCDLQKVIRPLPDKFYSYSQSKASCSSELVSFNGQGLGNEKKRKKVFNILKKQTSMNSAIFLKECHSIKEVERLWE